MTRRKRHRGPSYVEPVVYWIVYRPGKAEKKHNYAAIYFEAFNDGVSTAWGIDKDRAIRFFSRADAEHVFRHATDGWEDRDYVEAFQIVPADTVTT